MLYFVYEAMSGHGKFGKSNKARADHIMVFSQKNNGYCKKYQLITLPYAAKIANQVKVTVGIKTSGQKSSSSLRLGIKEETETIWDLYEQEKYKINELDIIDWIKNFAKKVVSKVKSLLSKGINAVLNYLGFSIDVQATNIVVF